MRLSLLAAVLSVTCHAWAGDKAKADRLFEQGRVLMQEDKLDQAAAQFEASLEAEPSVGALVNLARCHELRGRTATAVAEYRRAAKMADEKQQPKRAHAARKLASDLEPKLSRLTVKATEPVAGLRIVVVGRPIPASSLGKPLPLDPGEIRVEASAPGYQRWQRAITLGPDGDAQEVVVPRLEATGAGPVAPSDSGPPHAPPEPISPDGQNSGADTEGTFWSGQRIAALLVGGVGLGGVVLGSVFGLQASSQWDDALSYCAAENTSECSDEAGSLSQDATTSATVSTVGFVVGGAAIAAGLVLWFTAPSDSAPAEAAWQLVPTVAPDTAGAVWQGRF